MWAENGGLPVSPRVGLGPICHPLTHTVAARRCQPEVCGVAGRGSTWPPLPASPPLQDKCLE